MELARLHKMLVFEALFGLGQPLGTQKSSLTVTGAVPNIFRQSAIWWFQGVLGGLGTLGGLGPTNRPAAPRCPGPCPIFMNDSRFYCNEWIVTL